MYERERERGGGKKRNYLRLRDGMRKREMREKKRKSLCHNNKIKRKKR